MYETNGPGREQRQAFRLRHQLVRAGSSSQDARLADQPGQLSAPHQREKSYVSLQLLFTLLCYFVVFLPSWDLPLHSAGGSLAISGPSSVWLWLARAQLHQSSLGLLRLSGRQFIHPDRVWDSLRSCKRQFQLLNVWPG